MKRYIKSYQYNPDTAELDHLIDIVKRFTVTVVYERVGLVSASTSEIRPLMLPDGTFDNEAINEYENFILDALELFEQQHFVMVEERKSPYSMSYYCGMVKEDDYEKDDYRYILFVRLSDHDLGKEGRKRQKKYFDRRAEELKRPETKKSQVWKVKQVVVNKEICSSYNEALEILKQRISNL